MTTANSSSVLVWLRRDLRLGDHPALSFASTFTGVTPVFIWSPEDEGDWATGAASRWWLHHSLASLEKALATVGSRLVIRRGKALPALLELQRETGAQVVTWNEQVGPAFVRRDAAVRDALAARGTRVEVFRGATLRAPGEVVSGKGTPYEVFTPYWRSFLRDEVPAPLPPVRKLPSLPAELASVPLRELGLLPRTPWYQEMEAAWRIGEDAAKAKLQQFVARSVADYHQRRDVPSLPGTSRLSPHLHFGEISPRQIWAALAKTSGEGAETYRKELGWREFAHDLMFHQPATAGAPLRREFAAFPWRRDAKALRSWQQGMTGYPIVDAGMRELWATGWMHNRVRMIVASFLVKDLLLDWREGARWFWDTLVDADLANNTLGWQWAAGCGADAAPFFRIFNPVRQSESFDPSGAYIKRWVPELKRLSAAAVHAPWNAGLELDYPPPIVDHAAARDRALLTFDQVKRRARAR
jgi:deoxyribodipyrimidine photo-lyase